MSTIGSRYAASCLVLFFLQTGSRYAAFFRLIKYSMPHSGYLFPPVVGVVTNNSFPALFSLKNNAPVSENT
jgi:hypothetical protein